MGRLEDAASAFDRALASAPEDGALWDRHRRFPARQWRHCGGDRGGRPGRRAGAPPRGGAEAARRAHPRPIRARCGHAVVRPGARNRPRQCSRADRARRHPWAISAGPGRCWPTRGESSASPPTIRRLTISRPCWRPGDGTMPWRAASTGAPAVRSTTARRPCCSPAPSSSARAMRRWRWSR
jgi:hypothetical protein